MSLHIWRKIYYVAGWEYPEALPEADERQKHLKHVMHRQLLESKRVRNITIPKPSASFAKPCKSAPIPIPKRKKRGRRH